MVPLCKPTGDAIQADEKSGPVCAGPKGVDRAAIHAQVLAATAGQIGLD